MTALAGGLIEAAPTGGQASYTISPIKHKAGIHFTHLGELHMVTDSWKIVTHLKMDTLLDRNRQIASYVNQLQRRCENEIAIRPTCGEHLEPLLRRAEKLYRRINQVSEIPTYVPNRRRGLINGIGTLAKTIFGTMDANDAEQINKHLSQLDETQETLMAAMKKQVQITNNTLHHLHDAEKTIQRNEQILAKQTRLLRTQLETTLLQQTRRADIVDHFITLNALLTDLTQDVDDVLQYYTGLKGGIINSNVLSSAQITKLLQTAVQHLPNGLTFPIAPNLENTNVIEKLSSVTAYFDRTTLIAVITVPLISSQTFTVIEATPAPIHVHGNSYAVLVIRTPILVIDASNNQYVLTDQDELRECKRVATQYYCEQPMLAHNVNNDLECEASLWLQPADESPKNCEIKYIAANHTMWIRTSYADTWIFATNKPETLTIQCNERQPEHVNIDKTGILKIMGNCNIRSKDVVLKKRQTAYSQDLELSTAPRYDITLALNATLGGEPAHPLSRFQLDKLLKKPSEFSALYNELNQVESDLESSNPQPGLATWQIVHPTTTTIILIILSLLVVYLLTRDYQLRHKVQIPKTPKATKSKGPAEDSEYSEVLTI